MRRVLLVVTAVLALVGCTVDEGSKVDSGSGSTAAQNAPGSTSAAPATTAPAPTTAKGLVVGDKAALRNGDTVQVYAYQANVPSTNQFLTPKAGTAYAAIDVEGCAKDARAGGVVGAFDFKLLMPDNTSISVTFAGPKSPALSSRSQSAGDCNRGWLSFEVPTSAKPSAVLFDGIGTSVRWAIP